MKESIKELLGRKLHDHEVSALTSLLAGEISAVETYNLAMQKISDTELMPTLEECRNSHATRITRLHECLDNLGVLPTESAGVWGGFAQFVESSAAMFGDKAAIAVLAAGESYGLEQYRSHAQDVDAESWKIIEKDLLPAQEKTFQTMSLLNNFMRSPDEPR